MLQFSKFIRLTLFLGAFFYLTNAKAQNDTLDLFSLSLDSLMQIDVVSASRQIEPLSEAPVPVTVITSQMIEASGATNLQELLITYVPGMTKSQDHNEYNVAMRGVFASSQQKILFLLDGHRLNSRAYSSASPDFGFSLDKIKQVEILRGPGSALYGNVALTAVVNLVLKQGKDIGGTELTTGAGNYGQRKLSFLHGDQFDGDRNLIFWGNYYQADGQTFDISAEDDYSPNPQSGQAYIDGFKDMPALDIGMKYRNKNLTFLTNIHYAKYIEPFSAGGATGAVYNYDNYRTLLGTGPGLGSGSGHLSMEYSKELGNDYTLSFSTYTDINSIMGGLITNPTDTAGAQIHWREYSYGGILQASKYYETSGLGSGDIQAGFQMDGMRLFDSFFPVGTGGELTTIADRSDAPLLHTGREIIYSAFFQAKHRFSEQIILNLGLRFDNKDRHKGDNITDISPRTALIFIPNEVFDLKLSYARSFVDAPYWYRYNTLASYLGSEDLLPEYLSSVQLTPAFHFMDKKLNWYVNMFYNKLTDIIYRVPDATGNKPRYKNAGELISGGIENEVRFYSRALIANANLTYQHAISAQDYGVTDEKIHHIPGIYGALSLDWYPIHAGSNKLIVNLTARYIGEQLSPIGNVYKNGQPFESTNNTVKAVTLFNTAISLREMYGFGLKFRVSNLLDTYYEQGGSVVFPYPQAGRWYSVSLSYKIK